MPPPPPPLFLSSSPLQLSTKFQVVEEVVFHKYSTDVFYMFLWTLWTQVIASPPVSCRTPIPSI